MHVEKIGKFCRICGRTNNLKKLNLIEIGWFSINEENADKDLKICLNCRTIGKTLYENAKIFADCFDAFNIQGMALIL